MRDKVMGALYGMAIGDAMGMPPELWSRKRCLEHYGVITEDEGELLPEGEKSNI